MKKKKQKTFPSLSRTYAQHAPKEAKVFWFFFAKKNILFQIIGTQTFTRRFSSVKIGVLGLGWEKALPIALRVNGALYHVAVATDVKLLYVLRNDLALNGPKFGCGLGECGACTVLVDGAAARACVLPVGRLAGRDIVTLEGLGSADRPHPVQLAFITAQAAQCGYCLNGMIMTAKALLDKTPSPTEAEIRQALKYNLCRCGTHIEIMHAVALAAQSMAPGVNCAA